MAEIADTEKGTNQTATFLVTFSHPFDEENPKDRANGPLRASSQQQASTG
jgi:hypothetical protein